MSETVLTVVLSLLVGAGIMFGLVVVVLNHPEWWWPR